MINHKLAFNETLERILQAAQHNTVKTQATRSNKRANPHVEHKQQRC